MPGNPVHPKVRLAFLNFFFLMRRTSAAIHGSRTLHLACDGMAAVHAPCPSSLLDGTIQQGFNPSCRIPTTRAAMTSLCAFKANLASRGAPHASTCALPIRDLRRVLCEQNTLRRVTSWLHVWLESGRRGLNPCRMVPSKRDEVQGVRTAAMTSRARCKVRGL